MKWDKTNKQTSMVLFKPDASVYEKEKGIIFQLYISRIFVFPTLIQVNLVNIEHQPGYFESGIDEWLIGSSEIHS